MADENNIGADHGTSPDGAQNAGQEHMIPKARFDEVNTARRDLERRLAALEAQQQETLEAQLAEQQRWQELAEQRAQRIAELQPYQEQAESVEQTLAALLEAQLERLPDEVREMVNELPLPAQQKLDWLAKNQARLVRPTAPPADGGMRGDVQPGADVKLDPIEEMIMRQSGVSREDWVKYRQQRAQETARREQGDDDFLTRLRNMNQE